MSVPIFVAVADGAVSPLDVLVCFAFAGPLLACGVLGFLIWKLRIRRKQTSDDILRCRSCGDIVLRSATGDRRLLCVRQVGPLVAGPRAVDAAESDPYKRCEQRLVAERAARVRGGEAIARE